MKLKKYLIGIFVLILTISSISFVLGVDLINTASDSSGTTIDFKSKQDIINMFPTGQSSQIDDTELLLDFYNGLYVFDWAENQDKRYDCIFDETKCLDRSVEEIEEMRSKFITFLCGDLFNEIENCRIAFSLRRPFTTSTPSCEILNTQCRTYCDGEDDRFLGATVKRNKWQEDIVWEFPGGSNSPDVGHYLGINGVTYSLLKLSDTWFSNMKVTNNDITWQIDKGAENSCDETNEVSAYTKLSRSISASQFFNPPYLNPNSIVKYESTLCSCDATSNGEKIRYVNIDVNTFYEASTNECNDGIDNNRNGLTDYDEPSCRFGGTREQNGY